MKVIIAYASAGAGHHRAAVALYQYLREHRPAVKVELVDILDKADFCFRFSYRFGYAFLVRHAQRLWQLGFWLTDAPGLRPRTRTIIKLLNRFHTSAFARFLIRENPDVFLSTHFAPSEIAASLKTRKIIRSKVVTVITDFDAHSFWISEGTDRYMVASAHTRDALLAQGIPAGKIQVSGIPVDKEFSLAHDRQKLRVRLDLDPKKFTVLIATGSFGIGPIEQITRQLTGQVQLLVVCARNKRLLKRLMQNPALGVRVFGFVDNFHELIACADVIITKPGGLSIAESLALGVYPIFICPIPGQESWNIDILSRHGIGRFARDQETIRNTVMYFRDHPETFNREKDAIKLLARPNAAKDICDAVC